MSFFNAPKIPKEFHLIPPGAYRPLSDWYLTVGRKLAALADDYERGDGDFASLHQQVGRSRGSADMVRAHIVNGMKKADAYEAVRKLTGETIESIRSDYRHKYHSALREEANRARILKYHDQGFGPKAVATITGLPYAMVARTLKDAR